MLNSNDKTIKSKSIKHLFDVASEQGGINFYRLYLTATAFELDELVFEIGSNPDYQALIVDFLNQNREQAKTAEPFFNIHEARCIIIPEYGARFHPANHFAEVK
jgi:hypothetical protein